jgi:hypothetical protein
MFIAFSVVWFEPPGRYDTIASFRRVGKAIVISCGANADLPSCVADQHENGKDNERDQDLKQARAC